MGQRIHGSYPVTGCARTGLGAYRRVTGQAGVARKPMPRNYCPSCTKKAVHDIPYVCARNIPPRIILSLALISPSPVFWHIAPGTELKQD